MESQREVAEEWYDRIEVIQHEHYLATLHFARLHHWLGISLVLLSAIVGRCVFAAPQQKRHESGRVALGVLSVSATVLAALQTFLSNNERAEKHRMAGARYRALGWQLALMLAHDPDCSGFDDIRKQIDALARESPSIPKAVHKAMSGYCPRWQHASSQ
jgi:hypothetical protein